MGEFGVKSLRHDVADLPASERERYFDRRRVPPEVRAEVNSLCEFDSHPRSVRPSAAPLRRRLADSSQP